MGARFQSDPPRRDTGPPMRLVIQRVSSAEVEVEGRIAGSIGNGLLVLLGVAKGDTREDADFLVEGTETGTSIRANGLKMLDPFMESTNCVIVRSQHVTSRGDLVDALVERFAQSVRAVEVV